MPTTAVRELWFAIYLPSFLIAAGQQAVVILLPLYALQLDGGASLAATFMALRGGGSMCINVPAGMAVARWGDKTVMVAALIALGLCSGLLGLTHNVLVIGACATVYGAGSGAWLLARLAYVSDAAPLQYRGRALAALGGIQRVGLLAGPVTGGVLALHFGYATAFLAAGGCALASCLTVLPFTKNIRPEPSAGRAAGISAIGAVLRDHRRTFATAGVSTIGLTVLRSARQLRIPLWGAAAGLNAAQIGFTFMLSSAVEIAMAYPAGYVLDHRGHKFTALPCFGLLAISVALLPWVQGQYSLTAVALLAGIGNGFGSGIMMTLGSDYAPPAQRGQFLGVWRMLGDAGQVAGPLVIGVVAAVTTLAFATFCTVAIGAAGMAMMALVVTEPVRR